MDEIKDVAVREGSNVVKLDYTDRSMIPRVWNLDNEELLEKVKEANVIVDSRLGLMTNLPMLCKGNKCPYSKTCWFEEDKRPIGQRCPIEIAAIVDRFNKYCEALGITEKDIVDLSLVKELVDIEIQMLRADNKMAINSDFIEQVVVGVTESGDVLYKPELSKAVEYKEKLMKERHRILQLLNSTRKDKNQAGINHDPTKLAAIIMAQAKKMSIKNKTTEIEAELGDDA